MPSNERIEKVVDIEKFELVRNLANSMPAAVDVACYRFFLNGLTKNL